jgi:predicted ferric reductase
MRLIEILTILCTVSMTGTEFTVAMILNPALERLDRGTWLKTMPVLAKAMGRAMPVWYALGLVLIAAEEYLHFHTAARWWLGAAILLWVVSIVYSITMLVPINNRIADPGAGGNVSSHAEHERWDSLHRWRVALLLVATTCLLVGIA